jgi:hypothetical protein
VADTTRPASHRERLRKAYEAGFRGDRSPDWIADPDELDAYDRGLADHENPAGRTVSPPAARPAAHRTRRPDRTTGRAGGRTTTEGRPPAQPPSDEDLVPEGFTGGSGRGAGLFTGDTQPRLGGRVDVDDAAGLLLGLLAYAVGRAYLAGGLAGPGGVYDWLRAKFLNRTPPPADMAAAGRDTAALEALLLPTGHLGIHNAPPETGANPGQWWPTRR